jgi:hypothetical protein
MQANARHVRGSTRSCRPVLSPSATSCRRVRLFPGKCVHYTYKMRPNFRVQIIKCLLLVTYNFNALKCTDFPATPFPADENQSPPTESHDARFGRLLDCHPFSLGEKVRMRDKLATLCRDTGCRNKLFNTVQNETKRDGFEYTLKNHHVVPTTYADSARVRPILQEALMTREPWDRGRCPPPGLLGPSPCKGKFGPHECGTPTMRWMRRAVVNIPKRQVSVES